MDFLNIVLAPAGSIRPVFAGTDLANPSLMVRSKFLLILIPLFILVWGSLSFAKGGTESGGGGGVVFVCNNGSEVRLADTFSILPRLSKIQLAKHSSEVTEQVALDGILSRIGFFDHQMASRLRANLRTLVFNPHGPLGLLGDDDIRVIPSGCEKRQLAVQHLATGIVDYDTTLFAKLSMLERALFKLHEAYVKIYRSNSHVVRGKVSGLAADTDFHDYLLNIVRSNTVRCTDQSTNENVIIDANLRFIITGTQVETAENIPFIRRRNILKAYRWTNFQIRRRLLMNIVIEASNSHGESARITLSDTTMPGPIALSTQMFSGRMQESSGLRRDLFCHTDLLH